MNVLGVANHPDPSTADPSWVRALTHPRLRVPKISCAKASSVQLIMYDRPRPKGMQYISLNPIALALGDKGSALEDTKVAGDEGEEEKHERKMRAEKKMLVEKLKQHTVIKRIPSARDKALPKIVNQVNWSWELDQTLQKHVGRLGPRPKRSLSVSERVVESATTMHNIVATQAWDLFTVWLFPIIRRTFILVLLGHRMMAEMLLVVLELRFRCRSVKYCMGQ